MKRVVIIICLALAVLCLMVAGCDKLKLNIPGNVAGQVTNEGGQGIGFMSVKLCDATSGAEVQVVTAEDTGNFFFEKVDPGEYLIKLTNSSGVPMPSDSKPFKLGPGKTLTVAVMLKSPETQAAEAAGGASSGQ